MDIKSYKAALPVAFKSNVTLLAWARHGVGKTTAIEQFAKEGGHWLFNLRLGNLELGDLIGLPTTEGGVTKFCTPKYLQDGIDFANANPDKCAILHLDEINRIRKDMMSPVFQIALDGRLHETVFPSNMKVVASANPPTGDYTGVYDITDLAFLDRFCHIALSPTQEEWYDHMVATGRNEDMVLFYRKHPTMIEFISDAPFSVDSIVKPSRRSTEAAMRLYENNAPAELIYGCIGGSVATAFYAWLQKNKADTVRGENVRLDFAKFKKRITKMSKDGEVASLKVVCNELTDYYKTVKDVKDITKDEIENLKEFYLTIPEDLAYGQILLVLRGSVPLMDSDFGENKKYCEIWKKKVLAKPGLKDIAATLEPKADATAEKTA